MTSLYDSLSIDALLHERSDGDELAYSSKQLEYIVATNNGYQQSVEFDTLPITGKWALLKDGFLQLPLTIAPGVATSSATPAIAFKGSCLSLINGVSVKTSSGQVLVEERDSTVFSSHLRLMLEQHNDWFIANGETIMWAKDRCEPGVVSALTSSGNISNPRLSRYSAVPSVTVNGDRDVFNLGFAERRQMLLDSAISATGTYVADQSAGINTTLNIPLRYVHNIFEALDFPIINTRLTLTFWLNTTSAGRSYVPMCLGSREAGTVETGTSITTSIPANNPPRLYYHACTFNAAQNEVVMAKMLAGFEKKLSFKVYDYNFLDVNRSGSTSQFNFQISNNVRNPEKIFAMCYPTGVVNGVNWPSPLVTGSAVGLRDISIQVNGTNYYGNRLDSFADQYAALKDILLLSSDGAVSSQFSYGEWLKTFRILCFDISRAGSRQLDKNAPVSLSIQAAPINAAGMDVVYLVERIQTVKIRFGASDVLVEVGPQV